jgi:hypothetical protein
MLVRGIDVPGPESPSTEVVIVNEGGAGMSPRGDGDGEEVEAFGRGGVDIMSELFEPERAGFSVAAGAPGLSIKCTTAPSDMSYSFSSFESVKAFPLSKSLCESGGGAEGDALEMRNFKVVMGSVREMVIGSVSDGLSDLTVMLMV